MKKIYLFMLLIIGIFVITGCSNDASAEEKDLLLKIVQSEGYIEKDLKYIGKTYSKYGCNSLFGGYDHGSEYNVYEKNGKYYAINFDKVYVHNDENDVCNYKLYINYDVKYVEDSVAKLDSETGECNYIKDYIYKIDINNERSFCVRKKQFFGLIEKYYINEF